MFNPKRKRGVESPPPVHSRESAGIEKSRTSAQNDGKGHGRPHGSGFFILRMAFNNLFRYKKRTIITAFAIAIGLIFYIFMDSLLRGWYGNTERQYMDYEVASGRIVSEEWWEEKDRMPISKVIENPDEIITILDELDIAWTKRIDFPGELIFYKDPFPEDGSYPAVFTAVDPATDGEIFELAESINFEHSSGEFVSEGDDGIVVGNALAKKLGIEVGYPVRLQFTGKMGYQELVSTRVKGIVKTENHLLNLGGVFLALDAADYYLEAEGAVSSISLRVPGGRAGRERLAALDERLPEGLLLLGYEEIAADFMAMQEMENGGVAVFLVLIFLIAAVGISNTMMMAIFERRREIGMMRAQGVSDRRIRRMFALEAGGIGAIGTIGGLVGGALLNIPLVNIGLNYGALLQTEEDFVDFGTIVIDSYMKGVWAVEPFLIAAILAIGVSSLASWFPVRRMLKKSIPENLRTDG